MSTKDLYETLGVAPTASAAEIKKAYRRLAKKWHPDSTGGDKAKEERFKDVSTAYDILGDDAKRKQYDAMRANGFAGIPGAERGGPGVGFDIGDLFAQMFGGAGGPSAGGRRGGRGGPEFRVYTSGGGSPFGGGGSPFGGGGSPFGGGGAGPFAGFGFDDSGFAHQHAPRRPAPAAAPAERHVRAADGTKLVQRGADIHSDVRLTIDQAILGTVAEVATLAGKASVKIPPGTSSGVKLRLKGKGAKGAGGEVGDHLVTIQIDVPKTIDDESKKLLVELMQRIRRNP
jgi:DnaJ-class molecular chaperone